MSSVFVMASREYYCDCLCLQRTISSFMLLQRFSEFMILQGKNNMVKAAQNIKKMAPPAPHSLSDTKWVGRETQVW